MRIKPFHTLSCAYPTLKSRYVSLFFGCCSCIYKISCHDGAVWLIQKSQPNFIRDIWHCCTDGRSIATTTAQIGEAVSNPFPCKRWAVKIMKWYCFAADETKLRGILRFPFSPGDLDFYRTKVQGEVGPTDILWRMVIIPWIPSQQPHAQQ